MNTILCGTDFSDQAAGATRVAAALAAKWQDRLVLVHATGCGVGEAVVARASEDNTRLVVLGSLQVAAPVIPPIRRVLVTTDFSESENRAPAWAGARCSSFPPETSEL